MIKQSVLPISNTVATSVDVPNAIASSYTLILQNINVSGYIYIGNSSVTTSSYGFRIMPNQAFTIELPSSGHLYAIASDPGMSVAAMEIYRAI